MHFASKCNLQTPETHFISQKSVLENLVRKKRYITKAAWNQKELEIKSQKYMGGFPQEITLVDVEDMKIQSFFPSIVQELIDKLFEIRAFYLDGLFYCMAIFSQKDEQTSLDFRNYNKDKPNRNIPFELPVEIKANLTSFMKMKNLNSGSIDLIFSVNKEFIFLEVNSVGQFGWLSQNCNYYIEKKIASFLSNNRN